MCLKMCTCYFLREGYQRVWCFFLVICDNFTAVTPHKLVNSGVLIENESLVFLLMAIGFNSLQKLIEDGLMYKTDFLPNSYTF